MSLRVQPGTSTGREHLCLRCTRPLQRTRSRFCSERCHVLWEEEYEDERWINRYESPGYDPASDSFGDYERELEEDDDEDDFNNDDLDEDNDEVGGAGALQSGDPAARFLRSVEDAPAGSQPDNQVATAAMVEPIISKDRPPTLAELIAENQSLKAALEASRSTCEELRKTLRDMIRLGGQQLGA